MEARQVAVVGAGIAGLGAAWQLAQRGFRVALLESEERPGGRARSIQRDGFSIEPYGSLLSSADRALLGWIDELGLSDVLLPLRPVLSAHAQGSRVVVVDPRSWLGIARIPGIRFRHAARLLRLPRLDRRYGERIDSERPERAADLDDRSIADFGRLYFGRSVMERWMSPLVARCSLSDERDTSRALFLHQYRTAAEARLGLLRSTCDELIERSAACVSARTGVRVNQIRNRDGRFELALRSGDRDSKLLADAVVVATSAAEAARLARTELTLAERDHLGRVSYTPSLSLAVALRRGFSNHPQHIQFPHAEGSPLEAVLLEPGVAGGRIPEGRGLALLQATGAWSEAYFDAPDDMLRKELIEALARVLPRIRGAELFALILREPRAAPRFRVGRYREIAAFGRIQDDRRRQGRRLYFAGDYLMGPGWNAALAAGRRAAAAVEEDLGS